MPQCLCTLWGVVGLLVWRSSAPPEIQHNTLQLLDNHQNPQIFPYRFPYHALGYTTGYMGRTGLIAHAVGEACGVAVLE